jgi:phosphohistidine phosphatase
MILFVLRHGLAEEAAAGGDAARHLTDVGRERLQKAAEGMLALGIELDTILTSPLARAAETAEIVAGAYQNRPTPRVLKELSTGIAPADAITALALARSVRDESVMIVGHEPQLSALISLLLTGQPDGMHLRLRKGACVALGIPGKRIESGAAELLWMMSQRQLRKLRK